jgi:protein-S-isoprenylcysteine O-methyltransferase Ste14
VIETASASRPATPVLQPSLDRVALVDLAIRILLGVGFAVLGAGYLHNTLTAVQEIDFAQPDPMRVADAISLGAISLSTVLTAWLFVVRLKPIRKSDGLWPRAAALLGGFLMMGLLLLPRQPELPLAAKALSSILMIVGNAAVVVILSRLGRSFSILPEARRLVTTGPYRLVRHPLYLAEAVATIGIFIQYLSIWAALLVIAQFAFQLIRMECEEQVLRKAFPDYEAYSRRIARIIPGIY